MDYRQLEAFSAVMTVGSITGAGQMLNRSQPAVTRLIRDLEDELGFQLFERNGPKVTPTHHAFQLRAEVEHALDGVRQIRQSAERLAEDETREIRIVATPAIAAGLAPAALARMPGALRPRHIQLRSQSAEAVVQSVLSKTIDLGVVSLPLEHRGIDVHWIGEAPCVAVVSSDSPLATQQALSLDQLAEQPLITLSNPFRLRRRIDRALARTPSGSEILETNSSLNAIQMARAGLGVALVEPVSAHGVRAQDVTVLPLDVDIPFFFGVITPYAHPLSAPARALIEALETLSRETLPGFVRHELGAHDALLKRIHAADD